MYMGVGQNGPEMMDEGTMSSTTPKDANRCGRNTPQQGGATLAVHATVSGTKYRNKSCNMFYEHNYEPSFPY